MVEAVACFADLDATPCGLRIGQLASGRVHSLELSSNGSPLIRDPLCDAADRDKRPLHRKTHLMICGARRNREYLDALRPESVPCVLRNHDELALGKNVLRFSAVLNQKDGG